LSEVKYLCDMSKNETKSKLENELSMEDKYFDLIKENESKKNGLWEDKYFCDSIKENS
jgi:hypothetical protein